MKKLDLLGLLDKYEKLTFIRHLDSLQNAYYREDNSAEQQRLKQLPNREIPLSKLGFENGQKMAPIFAKEYADTNSIIHSGYKRTMSTWNVLSSEIPPDQIDEISEFFCPLLAERDDGFAYRMKHDAITNHYPFYDSYKEIEGKFFERPPGGESVFDLSVNRAYSLLNLLRDYHFGKRVILITHSGFIRAWRFLIENWSYDQAERSFISEKINNGSITEYINIDGELVLSKSNHQLHEH